MSVQCPTCGQYLTDKQLMRTPEGAACAYCGAMIAGFEHSTLAPPRQACTAAPAASDEPLVCPQCGEAVCEDGRFCATCGGSLWNDCRECGHRVFAAARLCPECCADLEDQRILDRYVALAKDCLEEVKQQPPCAESVRHLEQARLALGKALSHEDAAEARALVDEVNRLTVDVAWQAGEAAVDAMHLDEANYCYGQILEVSPEHTAAAACLQKLRSHRSELVDKALRLCAAGRHKSAATLLRTGVERFPDDAELADLWAEHHERAVQLQELVERIPVLAGQNCWCEVAQLLAELSCRGVALKGLEEETAKVQQRLTAVAPLVISAQRLLDEGNTAEAAAQANQVLQHVADHAGAMEIVELARSRDLVTQRRAAAKRRRRYVLASVLGLACLTLVVGIT